MQRTTSKTTIFGRALALGALASCTAWLAPGGVTPARACGGFFCSQQNPVDQSAENIIFVHDEQGGKVTAVIQILYQGPSEKFAWLLPVPGKPEVGVSSNIVFQNLRAATDPQYNLTVEVEGECMDGGDFFGNGGGFPTAGMAPSPAEDADGGVTVIDAGSVGPYDYVTISLDPMLAEPADAAVMWLTDNGYDVTTIGPEVLGPYLEDGLNLIAFKLTKGNEAGAIRPVVISYESTLPMIPIRPTQVAAVPDMGVRVWMVAAHQAIPKNYLSLVLNEALINWFCWSCNYEQVITAAADEAGGQGFTTELAAPSSDYDEAIFGASAMQDWQSYQATPFADGYEAVQEASWRYRGWDGFREAVCGAATLPTSITCDQFGQSPDVYRGQVQIDTTAFLKSLYEDVVKPAIETQALLVSQPYLTRLYTTMSPEEMTVDPLFDINPDLADYSNVHTAKQIIECSPDLYQYDAPWRIELPQGGVIRGRGQGQWPIDVATTDLPANHKVVMLTTEGAGEVVEDNSEKINESLFKMSGMTSPPLTPPAGGGVPIGGGVDPDGSDPTEMQANTGGDGGGAFCAAGAPGAPGTGAWWFALGIVGLVARLRRRR
jgi:MYXO-CTERM domain-containing protein